jgi:hypothetical protein
MPMSPLRRSLRLVLSAPATRLACAAGAAALAACADSTTAPFVSAPSDAPARAIAMSTAPLAPVLTRSTPLPTAVRVIALVGSAGGSFTMPQTGLTVTVPAGAVRKPTQITVTAPSGAGVWYEFGPSGTKFAVPLTLTQDLRATNAAAARGATFEAGYFLDGTLDLARLSAPVKEFLPVAVDGTGTQLSFKVSHFSGYMVSTGRSAQ